MITYHDGDLLKSGCKIICHQVNLQGVMGGGLAYQIAQRYPDCEKAYKAFLEKYSGYGLLGRVCGYFAEDGTVIANCFTQRANYDTDYNVLYLALLDIEIFARETGYTMGIPHGYGCGIANGDWEKVLEVIEAVFGKSKVECQIWKLK